MQNRRIQHFSVIFLLFGKLKLEVGRKEAPTLQFLTMKDKDPKDISDLLSDLKIKDNENNLGKYTIKKLDVKVDVKILYISIGGSKKLGRIFLKSTCMFHQRKEISSFLNYYLLMYL